MKVLLDECVPWPMHKLLVGCESTTAQRQSWGGIKNGELLTRAETQFDLFITADQGIRYRKTCPAGRSPFWNFPPTICAASMPPRHCWSGRSKD